MVCVYVRFAVQQAHPIYFLFAKLEEDEEKLGIDREGKGPGSDPQHKNLYGRLRLQRRRPSPHAVTPRE
jgi:hypothetical protein